MFQTRAGEHPPTSRREAAPQQPRKAHTMLSGTATGWEFTAVTYGDIFQTLLTAPVCILVTTYRKEKNKRHLSTLKSFSVV